MNDTIINSLGITMILNVTKDLSHCAWSSEDNEHITFVRIPVDDNGAAILYPYFEVSFMFRNY